MEEKSQKPISEECETGINHAVAYQMYISDAYLSMACYYTHETGKPSVALFFEDQSDVKRFQAKRFLRYLKTHEGTICLPVIEWTRYTAWSSDQQHHRVAFLRNAKTLDDSRRRPDVDDWEDVEHFLTSALQMENTLTKILEDLKASASQANETEFLNLLKEFLLKQKSNTDYLESQLAHGKKLEELLLWDKLVIENDIPGKNSGTSTSDQEA